MASISAQIVQKQLEGGVDCRLCRIGGRIETGGVGLCGVGRGPSWIRLWEEAVPLPKF